MAPIGTDEPEKTCRPTLDQPPSSGSRLTPRLMRACARSRRRVLSVLTRMVRGRGVSDAVKKSSAWKREVGSEGQQCDEQGGHEQRERRTSSTPKISNSFSARNGV